MLSQALTTYFPMAILAATTLAIFTHSPLVDASFSPLSLLFSKSSGGKCCGGAPRYVMKPSYSGGYAKEAFDDGTPLSFYRQQVARMYSGGGGGGSFGYMSGGGGGGGHHGYKSMGGFGGGPKSAGGTGYQPGMQLKQLYKNSFGYQSMLMGGGFMKKDNTGFGPAGTHTSKKWRGYGKGLLKSKSGYHGGDRLTNVRVEASGASDEYKDSYVTMIANTLKRGAY